MVAQRGAYRQRWGTVIPRRNRGYTSKRGYYGRFNGHTHQRPELKFLDGTSTFAIGPGITIVSPGTEVVIIQNTTESGRIGRKITLKKIQWRFHIDISPSSLSTNTHDKVSVIIYLDKQCNGATAGKLDIWDTDFFQSYRNLAQGGRFKILGRQDFELWNPSGAGNGTTNEFGTIGVSGSFNLNVNIPIEYNGTTGAITEIKSNNIGFAVMSQHGLCGMTGRHRMRFIG